MTVRDKQAYKLVGKCIAGLQEEGPLTRRDVVVWVDFHVYIVNLLEDQGMSFRGHTVKVSEWATLLVVKVVREKLPQVAFFTERDTTGCMRVFLRQLDKKEIDWKPDKYA